MIPLVALITFGLYAQVIQSTVVVLNDTNFDSLTRDGAFFVNIYAPWCAHCKQLQPVWERVAKRLEGQVTVAKIDGTVNSVLLQRFYVQKFPTVAHLEGGQMRRYEGPRSERELIDFALEGWRDVPPEPFYMAPNSTFGRLIGFILGVPQRAKQMHRYLHETLHFPELAIVVVFLTFPILLGVASICFLDYWHTSRAFVPPPSHSHQQ